MTPILGEGRAVLLTPPGITHAKEARDGLAADDDHHTGGEAFRGRMAQGRRDELHKEHCMSDIRKACVEAIFREFEDEGDAIRPACGDGWDEIEARRSLGHIVGCVDLDVVDLVDIVIDTINKEL